MNKYYDETIGSESILPVEIIDLLQSSAVDQHLYESITATSPFLDEHELAMAA